MDIYLILSHNNCHRKGILIKLFIIVFFFSCIFIACSTDVFADPLPLDTLYLDSLYHIQAEVVQVNQYQVAVHVRGFIRHHVLDRRYGGYIADTSVCWAIGPELPTSVPPYPTWNFPPYRVTHDMLEEGSDSSFTRTYYIGPGSQTGTFHQWVGLCHYEGGLFGTPPWYQFYFYKTDGFEYSVEAAPGELNPFPVDFDFCDANFNELPVNYVVGYNDTLYIKLRIDPPEHINPYTHCALVCEQFPADTLYYDVPVDTTNTCLAKGKVFPAGTLGGIRQMHGFTTVHGYAMKGDSIVGEDWIDVGQLQIIVRGTTPFTANSFLSTNQLEFEAVCRSHSGSPIGPDTNLIWGAIALNDTSGSLSPDSGRGQIFHAMPNPPPAPYTRGQALAYKCSVSVNVPNITALDWVILVQDTKDQLIQEYIDTEKSQFPSRDQFRFSLGSCVFSDSEFCSSDYDCFLFSHDLLNGLIYTYFDYGYSLHVHQFDDKYRAYLSPNNLFASKPPVVTLEEPTYWENNVESPHIYGGAADIQVIDRNLNGCYLDDWDTLAVTMLAHGINPNYFDSTYIHAEDSSPFLSSLVSIMIKPDRVRPGYGCDLDTLSFITRRCSIYVRIDTSLSPYTGDVEIRVEEVPYSGGHQHTGRPLNPYPQIHSVTRDSLNAWRGQFRTSYSDTCKYGGLYRFIAYYRDGSQAYYSEDTLTISSVGMVEFPPDTSWKWTGRLTAHYDNHYIDTLWIDRLNDIIHRFYEQCRNDSLHQGVIKTLRINDISLLNGGMFDIGPAQTCVGCIFWNPPHSGHRGGYGVDISYNGFNKNEVYYQWLKELCRRIGRRPPATGYSDHIHCYICSQTEKRWP